MSVEMISQAAEYTQTVRGDKGSCPSLDSVKTNCNKRLSRWFFKNLDTGKEVPFRCKSWHCEVCGPRKSSRFRHQAGLWAEKRGMNRLVTLTLDPKKLGADPYAYLSQLWRKFRVYLTREYGSVSFLWVMELQRNGRPHLHILVNKYLHQAWLSKTWDALGGGRIVDVRYVDIHRVRGYLAKYLNKAWESMAIPDRKRRYATSRDIRLWEDPDGDGEDAASGRWVLFASLGRVISRAEYDQMRQDYESELARARAPT